MQGFKSKHGNSKLAKQIESRRPKKALSAYMIFVRETRQKVCDENPDMHALDIMKEVGRLWQSLNSKDKSKFDEQAQLDKIRFKTEIEAFQNEINSMQTAFTDTPDQISKYENNRSSRSKMGETHNATALQKDMVKNKLTNNELMKRSVLQKPKRPYSAYIYFSQEVRSKQN